MARIINAKEVLQIYAAAFPEDEMQLELSDKQLSVNNGYYYLCKGKCMYSTERLPGTHIQMNISELTDSNARDRITVHFTRRNKAYPVIISFPATELM